MADIHTDTLEGTIGPELWFHYDLTNDVLYLRVAAHRDTPCHGEETGDGRILLRSEADESIIGLTVVNWWKRFGDGALPDSLQGIEAQSRPWSERMAA